MTTDQLPDRQAFISCGVNPRLDAWAYQSRADAVPLLLAAAPRLVSLPRRLVLTVQLLLACGWLSAATTDPLENADLLRDLNTGAIGIPREGPPQQAAVATADYSRNADQYLNQMKEEFARGLLEAIRQHARGVAEARPNDADANGFMAILLASENQYLSAEDYAKKAMSASTNSVLAHYAQALVLANEEKKEEAMAACKRAIRLDAKHPSAYDLLGNLYLSQKDSTNALENFKRAAEVAPNYVPARIRLGRACLRMGDYASAAALFARVLEIVPKDLSTRLNMASAYEGLGRLDDAISQLRQILLQKEDSVEVLARLGRLQMRLRRYPDALASGQKLKSLKSPLADPFLAEVSLRAGKSQEARAYLTNNPSAVSHYLLGLANIIDGDLASAAKEMQTVCMMQSNFFQGFVAQAALKVNLGQALDPATESTNRWGPTQGPVLALIRAVEPAAKGAWPEVLAELQAASGLTSDFTMTGVDAAALAAVTSAESLRLTLLGVVFMLSDFDDAALAHFQQALKPSPDCPIAHYLAGVVCLKRGEAKPALGHFEDSLRKTPTFFSGLATAAGLRQTAGDFAKAAELYAAAERLKSTAMLSLRLAACHDKLGNVSLAEQHYRKAIELEPGSFAPYNDLAYFYCARKTNLDEALRLAKKADSLRPGLSEVQDTVAWVLYQKKEYAEALKYATQATGRPITSPVMLYHLGAIHAALNQKVEAKAIIQRALSGANDFEGAADARKLLGQLE